MLDAYLKKAFAVYGSYLRRHYLWFIILPLISTCILSSGFALVHKRKAARVDQLYVPENGAYYNELSNIKKVWKLNITRFHFADHLQTELFVEFLAVSETNILNPDSIHQLTSFNNDVRHLKVPIGHNLSVNYEDVCLRLGGTCYGQSHLLEINDSVSIPLDIPQLTYPIANQDVIPQYIAHSFGKVKLSKHGRILEAKALRLQYFLRDDTPYVRDVSTKVSAAMVNYALATKIPNVTLYAIHATSLNIDLNRNGLVLLGRFIPLGVVMVLFVFLTSFHLHSCDSLLLVDWLRSQPLQALCGILTAGMGVFSGCGLVLLTGMTQFDTIVFVVPFLILCRFQHLTLFAFFLFFLPGLRYIVSSVNPVSLPVEEML